MTDNSTSSLSYRRQACNASTASPARRLARRSRPTPVTRSATTSSASPSPPVAARSSPPSPRLRSVCGADSAGGAGEGHPKAGKGLRLIPAAVRRTKNACPLRPLRANALSTAPPRRPSAARESAASKQGGPHCAIHEMKPSSETAADRDATDERRQQHGQARPVGPVDVHVPREE